MTQVLQQAFTTSYHLHQPAIAREVFFIVILHVAGYVVDTLCEHCYLRFYGACVLLAATIGLKNVRFLFSCNLSHLHQNFKIVFWIPTHRECFFERQRYVNIVEKIELFADWTQIYDFLLTYCIFLIFITRFPTLKISYYHIIK